VAFSFNHQIRFNNSHQFNNPFGRERSSFNETMRTNLIQFVRKLHHTTIQFTYFDFEQFDFEELTSNDFVYCDPPYLITTGHTMTVKEVLQAGTLHKNVNCCKS
jgi:DNA adenine methylase